MEGWNQEDLLYSKEDVAKTRLVLGLIKHSTPFEPIQRGVPRRNIPFSSNDPAISSSRHSLDTDTYYILTSNAGEIALAAVLSAVESTLKNFTQELSHRQKGGGTATGKRVPRNCGGIPMSTSPQGEKGENYQALTFRMLNT
eukprot:Blabericola_migrator_1__13462@NODE_971_length_5863_cov_9_131470_g673_i0_p4_GENE_NODE_971_length_5863_cov_9_131470_g673_i0NODE_971_length_5863_cov_9_131470_g673_i0_p4_ORF_typecomplete_len142_score15_81_NODE_971_length_5863_cov_9_131470_g673_i031293554